MKTVGTILTVLGLFFYWMAGGFVGILGFMGFLCFLWAFDAIIAVMKRDFKEEIKEEIRREGL